MRHVLVTGATGFIARHLVPVLQRAGWRVSVSTRAPAPGLFGGDVAVHAVGDLGPDTDWTAALDGVDAVVHLAARVHVMDETDADPLAAFRRANTDGTRHLAEQAVSAGAKRFVFVSSIKVNGEAATADAPFTEAQAPAPTDPYGVSKWEAEQALFRMGETTALEPVVVRPPLVYGPGVKANFLSLMKAAAKRLPLPLGAIDNRRSLVYVGNLADAIRACLEHDAAPGRVFLVRDGDDVSTGGLYRRLGRALGRGTWVVPVPPALLRLAGRVTGKGAAVARLLDSLVVDDRQIRDTLNWHPPFTLDDGLAATARAFEAEGGPDRKDT